MLDSGSKSIRVLHVGSPTGLYGAERWILALTKHLPSRVESWVAVIKDSPELDAPLCQEAARLGLRTRVFTSYGKLSLSAIGQVRSFIRENSIDIAHTHGYKTDLIGRLAVRATPCKTVVTPHGWSVNAGAALGLYEALDRIVFLFVDAVVPLSAELHRGLARLPGLRRRLRLIENGVDLSDVDAASEVSPAVQRWRRDGTLILGYIGQLITRKRIDTLIRAFRELPRDRKHLCIVGDGPQRAELERLSSELEVSEQVTFFGFREDRLQLLRGFDVFVLPSELEGIPRCLMEAMSAGVAVIASDIPGCRDVVEDGATGLLFTPGNAAELTRKIAMLADNAPLRTSLALAGCKRIRNTHSAEAMAGRYLALYEELVACGTLRPGNGTA